MVGLNNVPMAALLFFKNDKSNLHGIGNSLSILDKFLVSLLGIAEVEGATSGAPRAMAKLVECIPEMILGLIRSND